MDNKFQTSFIPKRSLDENGKVKVKTPRNALSILATFILVIALIAAAGAFAYSLLLDKKIESTNEKLVEKEASLRYDRMDDIVRIDNKLKAASNLLNNHTAVSQLFSYLEESTITNLRYSDFKFTYVSPSRVSLSLKGEAATFGAVAKQAELFTATSTRPFFKDPIFSDVDRDATGNISFTFLTTVDSSALSYKNSLNPQTP